ncbi:Gamma Purothionin [Vigna unguiculata]|uniref:Gamma Purothionin n=1 Tax=Vigna unguiculata TaxID=3917 RepID=A0A4D6L936_VIGUN|nr:Gamma Purothionin [Vigna unguiculata]
MERKTILGFMLLLVLIFASDVAVKKTEARECETPSKTFRGLCISDRNCEAVCNTEGFPNGKCEGLRQRCMCIRNC